MAEKQLYRKNGSELLLQLEKNFSLLKEKECRYVKKSLEKPLQDITKIMKLMEAMREDTFEQITIYDGNTPYEFNAKNMHIITYGGREIFRIYFFKDNTWSLFAYPECRSGFDSLYYRPGMPGFEETKRHFEAVSTEVTALKQKHTPPIQEINGGDV